MGGYILVGLSWLIFSTMNISNISVSSEMWNRTFVEFAPTPCDCVGFHVAQISNRIPKTCRFVA